MSIRKGETMKTLKKLFGGINLTWIKIIIFAVVAGVYTAAMAMIPAAKDTSFADITISFEVWILFGIIIIMNSKSAVDSALKCFVFFLISQPLVYLIQDMIYHNNLFSKYYRFWIMWTIATIPMGFIGYYMKKNKWWGLLILAPMMVFLGLFYNEYLGRTMYAFPHHLLTCVFCFLTLIIYPIAIFDEKKIKVAGITISILIIAAMTVLAIGKPPVYNTTILVNGDENHFDDTYKVYLADETFGKLYIVYEDGIEDYMVNAEFRKSGKTEVVLVAPDGKETVYEIEIKDHSYDINKK